MIQRRLALLGVAAFATMAALRVCDAMLPALAAEFGTGTGRAGQVVAAFAVAYGAALLLYGPLADRYGKFGVVSVATLSCTAGSVACALASSLDGLVASRAFAGAAAAGVTPVAMAWIGDQVPYERRQVVLAQLIGSTTLGLIAGPWVGGVLADTVGWRSAFVLLALVFAVAGGLMCVEAWRGRSVSASASGPATPPTTSSPHRPFHATLRTVLEEPWARRVLVFAFVEGAFVFGGLAFLPAHLHARFDLPIRWAGAVLVLYGIGGLLYSRLAPRLLRGVGEAGLARIGATLMCVYFGLLAALPAWSWALPACLIGGLGFYMLHSTLQTHATQMAPAARATAVTSFSASLFIGHSLGVAVAGAVVDHQSAVPVFVASAFALPLLGWWFAAEVRRRDRRDGAPGRHGRV